MIQPTLINLHPNGWIQSRPSLHCYPFAVKLVRCVGSYNTLNDLADKVCVPNKTEDLDISMLIMITCIKEIIY